MVCSRFFEFKQEMSVNGKKTNSVGLYSLLGS